MSYTLRVILHFILKAIGMRRFFCYVNRTSSFFRPLGVTAALGFAMQDWLQKTRPVGKIVHLRSKKAKYPLLARARTSDFSVFHQIFIDLEYGCLDDLSNVHTIIDCGMNVGYSSVYFLNRFPEARLIGVEPDKANFNLAVRNVSNYPDRATVIQAGVWSHSTSLRLSPKSYRDGQAWALQVEECDERDVDRIPAFDLNSIFETYSLGRVSLLKMDIEGAEAVVFKSEQLDWLSKVDNLVIELHDDSHFGPCSEAITSALLATGRFSLSQSGELSVFKSKSVMR